VLPSKGAQAPAPAAASVIVSTAASSVAPLVTAPSVRKSSRRLSNASGTLARPTNKSLLDATQISGASVGAS
jgi:hypothetical protein